MIKTYEEALEKLFKSEQVRDYSLEKVQKAISILWNPLKNIKVIHIAWTNGKWSTSKMVFSILKEAKKKVTVFTSPHLIDIKERFDSEKWQISEEDFLFFTNKLFNLEMNFSYFEYCFLISCLFAEANWSEFFVVEVWFWGLLDSTNIVSPKITAITSISFDHMDFLWDTLEEISEQKAWIIKEKIPIVVNHKNKKIEAIAKEKNAKVIFTKREVETNLMWKFQKKNAGIAYEICTFLWIKEDKILSWLKKVEHRWRLDLIEENLLIDGSHNEDSLKKLKDFISGEKFKKFRKTKLFISVKKGKNTSLIESIFWKNYEYKYVKYDSMMVEKVDYMENIAPERVIEMSEKEKDTLFVVFWSLYMIWIFYELINKIWRK